MPAASQNHHSTLQAALITSSRMPRYVDVQAALVLTPESRPMLGYVWNFLEDSMRCNRC